MNCGCPPVSRMWSMMEPSRRSRSSCRAAALRSASRTMSSGVSNVGVFTGSGKCVLLALVSVEDEGVVYTLAPTFLSTAAVASASSSRLSLLPVVLPEAPLSTPLELSAAITLGCVSSVDSEYPTSCCFSCCKVCSTQRDPFLPALVAESFLMWILKGFSATGVLGKVGMTA